MTDPANAFQDNKGDRYYVWPPVDSGLPQEFKVPSVTTILDGGLPKQAYLKPWAAKCVATYAVDNVGVWTRLGRSAAIDLLKREPIRFTEAAQDKGTIVHTAVEAFAKGEDVGEHLSAMSEPARMQARGACRFLRDCVTSLKYVEATVYSREHGYAGTADLFCSVKLPGWSRARSAIADYKTGKSIYPEMGFQLAAYSRGDFLHTGDGRERVVPKVKDGFVVRPTLEGGYEVRHFSLTDSLFDLFLNAKTMRQRDKIARAAMNERVVVA